MQVVIAGGSGLIGRAVARALAGEGRDVVVLSREPRRIATALPPGVRAAPWDGRTAAGWVELLAPGAALLNLAGEGIAGGRWTAARKRRIRDSRVDSGAAMVAAVQLAAADGRAPAVLAQASAVGYYGDGGDREMTEDRPPGDGFLAAVSQDWEAASGEVEAHGVRRVLLRTGIVLAREDGALAKLLPAFRAGLGGPLGDGRQWFPWIHLADEVAAILFLLANPATHGAYNLCAPRPVTSRDFARTLGRRLHRPSALRVPAPALRLLLGEMAGSLLAGQRAIPRRLLDAGFAFRFPDLDPALADLLEPALAEEREGASPSPS
jgi:uncharacterized protein (TIGR01777 family)